jgi:hypothetical protein
MRQVGWVWLAAVLLASPAVADQVTEQIDQALQYYREGDLAAAVSELEFAIQDIKSQVAQRYVTTFPDPPSGWVADEPSQESTPAALFGGGTTLTRVYRQSGGEGQMTATLMVDSPMIQGLMALIGRENAVLTWDEASRSGEINLGVAGKVLTKVEGRNLPNGEPLVELLKGFRFAEIEKLVGR